MGVVNRRNAVVGWAAWKLAKRVLRKKAAEAPPTMARAARRPKALVAFLVAAAAGAATFIRSRGRGSSE